VRESEMVNVLPNGLGTVVRSEEKKTDEPSHQYDQYDQYYRNFM
jgi:hypothetical protein